MNFEHVFDQLELTTDPFAVCELRGECDLGLGQDANATLHYILAGEGAILIRGEPAIEVSPGSLVLIPALQSHALRSFGRPGEPVPKCDPAELKLRHVLEVSRDGGDDNQVIALCARVRVGLRGAEDVIDLIRSPIVERIDPDNPLRPVLNMILQELSRPTTGSRAMIRSLLTQCMIELLRRRVVHDDEGLRWMAALRDPSVWEALRALLDAPGDAHTVESLAARVGMSRSTFAQRFAAAYGSGPIELLRDLRLHRAARLLRDGDLPVKTIAHSVGFSSRTAFSRLFEQRTGQSPIQYRQQQISQRQIL
ncbi:AraC-like DNA-binding protein [Labrenzia sp. EL_208]|uniref:AraC family transcriptional regulator n=1 Tax=Roseibium album TaxID=311410 RepID=UPI0018C91E19|nr:AraC-like DNA-binding protein [Labrenzia sp. EL_162]MBG6162658.1 AraC-like DNA-binding protein [Labrenzia sp. EL_195]MBG6177848.1 AraC-like DNA-binding protein [Labrenzia sp. EL_132]MBG6196309.1 AraC-like DNA-binding protein [Labrenzia sp. EL_159]MBG6201736.1 AraC-like DNA-binding protein [Labrenzia sp. EL_13]MBG6232418.1 AraC-like DNA-binding protein [Labrenzia sp. EL_208]